MRILFTIPHFFNPEGSGQHGSLRKDPQTRRISLTTSLTALKALYSKSQYIININNLQAIPANQNHGNDVDIIVCTTQSFHLLPQIPLTSDFLMHHNTKVEPMLLGFECQAVLKSCLGKYDYYCYLEDDLILHDPWFFTKLQWFNHHTGNDNLLQPNRYELSPLGTVPKAYIDGNLKPEITAKFQNIREKFQLKGKVMEKVIAFHRTLNPHSGCYFLNAEQMTEWASKPYFLDRDTSFIGPLESAATLGVMKTFKIYKPAIDDASFLEIQHFGTTFLSLIGNQISVLERQVQGQEKTQTQAKI
ncbi:calcium-binding protein [Okeania sp.]|uniref:calcium-binding protein n=1 Tax=Okeania sp. TaxID=3100323 RepID=UPI002B4B6955|nr:calcium-binding protein [Okeania sp.]MEB3341370.1 calcium-binding protein [Okeania sp.]